MTTLKNFDTIIIGGSFAGLSAAMALGRSLRHVLVIDAGSPCNSATPHSHNFLTQDGKTPEEITSLAKKQVANYKTVQFLDDLVTHVLQDDEKFKVETEQLHQFTARKIIIATGIKDLLPPILGLKECWGKSVIHCPYCHGYEFKQSKTAILANGDAAFHLAGLIDNLTNNLTILTNGKADFTPEQFEKIHNHQIKIIEDEVTEFVHINGMLQQVRLQNELELPFDAVYARVPFEQNSALINELGLELMEPGYIKVDHLHRTSLPGVFAAGDNSSTMRSVANAVAAGNFTGAMVNKELVDEDF